MVSLAGITSKMRVTVDSATEVMTNPFTVGTESVPSSIMEGPSCQEHQGTGDTKASRRRTNDTTEITP